MFALADYTGAAYAQAVSSGTAALGAALAALGITGGPNSLHLTHFDDWGFHIYCNLPALVKKAGTSPDGFPWTHPANAERIIAAAQNELS